MPISIKRYVDITSGVGGAASVGERELILRIVTSSTKVAPGTIVSFENTDDVAAYFDSGSTQSEQTKRATKYLGFVSKQINKPKRIEFVRWNEAATAPMVVGDMETKVLSAFTQETAGKLVLVINSVGIEIDAINWSAATSLTQCASILQTAIRTSTNPQLATATVSYDTNLNRFTLTCGSAVSDTISVGAPASDDVATLLGWNTAGAVCVPGYDAQSAVQAISQSAQSSDNFGSFLYMDILELAQVIEVAAWNHAQNNKFLYCMNVKRSDAAATYAALKGYSGTAVHCTPAVPDLTYNFTEQCPAELLAATNYTRVNANQNYMYNQFPTRSATVFDDPEADTLDGLRMNYIGQTQKSGAKLEFYQTGILMGGSTAAVDMNIYANEMWLKDAIVTLIMNYFLAMPEVSANTSGRAGLLGVLQDAVDRGLNNGTISVGKPLDVIQKSYIAQMTGDPLAWFQVQSLGYWLDVSLVSYVDKTGASKWKAAYMLIYSKNDQIRKVEGSDVMI